MPEREDVFGDPVPEAPRVAYPDGAYREPPGARPTPDAKYAEVYWRERGAGKTIPEATEIAFRESGATRPPLIEAPAFTPEEIARRREIERHMPGLALERPDLSPAERWKLAEERAGT